jgi:SagB-type dehydrogenase family enzyme
MNFFSPVLSVLIILSALTLRGETEDSMSIGSKFHFETSYDEQGLMGKDISSGEEIPLYKVYKGAKKIKLPGPAYAGKSIEETIRSRRSVRSFTGDSIRLDQLSQILLSADGITHSEGGLDMRAAPSGGALYPIDIYVVVRGATDIPQGIYHFQVSDSTLELVKAGDFTNALYDAAWDQEAIAEGQVNIILTSRFDRITEKYSDRGYRYAYIEAGAIAENICLQATSLGLGAVIMGAFTDTAVNAMLEIEGLREAALLIIPIGHPR